MKSKQNLSILNISLTRGGAEKVISLLLKKLVNDYNVTLILLYDDIHFPIPEQVVTVTLSKKTPDRSFYLKVFDTLGFIFKYNGLLKKYKINYAVSFLAFPNLINGIVARFNPMVKMFISERGFPSDNTTSKLSLQIARFFYPIFYNRCYKLFSNSIYINEDLEDNFKVKIPMEVIYNPIELPASRIIPETLVSRNSTLKIITAGTINTRKNQMMIIRAIQNLGSDYQLTVLGSGPLEGRLRSYIEANKLEDNIFLKGSVKNVNRFLLENHCFVLSSFTEGFPNALLEAMAIGLPCISTNCLSGPLELLNDNQKVVIAKGDFCKAAYGLLVNNDDHEALTKALEFLRLSPNERVNYSELSLKRANAYNLENIYNQFSAFITN